MTNALLYKLQQFTIFSDADKQVLKRISSERIRHFGAREDVVREGEKPTAIYVMLEGWACRYKQLENGRRQIIAFFLPGDICDPHVFILHERDHSIGAITDVSVAEIDREPFEAMMDAHPRVARALGWDALVGLAIQREWTVSLGQRTALARLAHLLCELYIRLKSAGRARRRAYDFPLTQAELGEAAGLSTVHVNRTLQELRAAQLIRLRNRTLEIADLDALMRVALFNPNYLHLNREDAHLERPGSLEELAGRHAGDRLDRGQTR